MKVTGVINIIWHTHINKFGAKVVVPSKVRLVVNIVI